MLSGVGIKLISQFRYSVCFRWFTYRSVEFYTAISDTLWRCVFLEFSAARCKVCLRQLVEICTSCYILQICPDRISRVNGRKWRRQRTLEVAGGPTSRSARLSSHKHKRPCLNYSSLQNMTIDSHHFVSRRKCSSVRFSHGRCFISGEEKYKKESSLRVE